MQLAIMEVICLMSDSTLRQEIVGLEVMEYLDVLQMNVGVNGQEWRA